MAGREKPVPAPILTCGRVLLPKGLRDPYPGQALDSIPLVVHTYSGQVNPQAMDQFSRDGESGGDTPIEVAHGDATAVEIDIAGPKMGGGISRQFTGGGKLTEQIGGAALN